MDSRASPSPDQTVALLAAARSGDARAADDLFAHLYHELRQLSGAQLAAEASGVTLSATGLVHEAYLRLLPAGDLGGDRTHFFALAARAMRRILIDRARARRATKRGGNDRPITLNPHDLDARLAGLDAYEQVLAVDAALERLSAHDDQLGRLVELRFFGGLDVDEAATVLGVSPRTAARLWARAKAHLLAELA